MKMKKIHENEKEKRGQHFLRETFLIAFFEENRLCAQLQLGSRSALAWFEAAAAAATDVPDQIAQTHR